ncbi:MAG: sugar phosphate nucleotidyltransferase [Candidatus Omnitrophota bacterium]
MTFVILLAGGSGERFWPKSRMTRPKQFLAVGGKETLLAQSLRRLSQYPRRHIRIVAPQEQIVLFKKCGLLPKDLFLWEPLPRNTAAAVALAANELARLESEATLVILPCDAWVRDTKRFLATLKQAEELAKVFDGIVLIGAHPTYPATGFGYIGHARRGERRGKVKAYRVERFVEKPALRTAQRLLREGSVLWNAGIFVARIPVLLEAFRVHMPLLDRGFRRAAKAKNPAERKKALSEFYRTLPSISFDHGILEHMKSLLVVPGRFGWQDLGSWRSLEQMAPAGRGGNLLFGDAYAAEGKENIFVSEAGHLLAGIGVSGLIVVHTSDATLLCPKERAEDVKRLVRSLKTKKAFSRYL